MLFHDTEPVSTKGDAGGVDSIRVCDGALSYVLTEEPLSDNMTKTTVIYVPSGTWYWGVTTGGNRSGSALEEVKWMAAPGTISSSALHTGKYQTQEPSLYNYYITNCSNLNIGGRTTVDVPDNNTDYIVGRTWGSTSAKPRITLEHLFARIVYITFNTKNDFGYSFTNVTISIESKDIISGTSGSYNISQGLWVSSTAPLGLTVLGSNISSTLSTDLYLIPADYYLYVNYRVHNGEKYLDISQKVVVSLSKKGCRYRLNLYPSLDNLAWSDNPCDDWDDGWDDDPEINL
jgi:hypothetical protein